MRIGLYSPYLSEVFGGGERHLLSIASCLSRKHQVDLIFSPDKKITATSFKAIIQAYQIAFALDLSRLSFAVGPFSSQSNWRDRTQFTRGYDIFYYMTDGSFFVSRAKKNIVHFQIPFTKTPNLSQRLKLATWQIKTANSQFTADWLEKNWHFKFDFIHRGSVNTNKLVALKKQNIIISVGRFISAKGGKHCKRQDFLVKTFAKMCDAGLKDWMLILAGPIEKGQDNRDYATKVKKMCQGYPIMVDHRANFSQLAQAYGQAKIYWHAAGYGVDQDLNPNAVEHLGLTTAEAMAAGCVPVVINKGGQPEVVDDKVNGLLWSTQAELISHTNDLIASPAKLKQLAKAAMTKSSQFSQEKFCKLTNTIFSL